MFHGWCRVGGKNDRASLNDRHRDLFADRASSGGTDGVQSLGVATSSALAGHFDGADRWLGRRLSRETSRRLDSAFDAGCASVAAWVAGNREASRRERPVGHGQNPAGKASTSPESAVRTSRTRERVTRMSADRPARQASEAARKRKRAARSRIHFVDCRPRTAARQKLKPWPKAIPCQKGSLLENASRIKALMGSACSPSGSP